MYLVYVIEDNETPMYVGITGRRLRKRFQEHTRNLLNKKQGDFKMTALVSARTKSDANWCEKYFIKKYDTFHNGLNETPGGNNGVLKHSEATKKKISEHWYKYFETHDVWNKGKTGYLSEESLNIMREAKLGRTFDHTEETKRKQSDSHKGKILSSEHRKKLSKAKIKKYKIIKPNGDIEIIENITKYCQDNNLNAGNMVQVAKGKRKQSAGYRVFSI